jgi:hypothetical protein
MNSKGTSVKARLVLILIGLLILASSLSANNLTSEEQKRVEYLHSALQALRNGMDSDSASLIKGEPGSRKCATPLVLEAFHYHTKYGAALGFGDYFARPSAEEFPNTIDSPGGHFKIHYTTDPTNRHVVNTDYGDQNSNGITDYVEIVARIADSVWLKEIDQLGFHPPVDDGEFEWGGDSRQDIYLKDLDPRYYGITWTDGQVVGNGQQATTFMELRNHYEILPEYDDHPLDALRVTIAHEFFHSVQFWYDAFEQEDEEVELMPNAFWLEMSAVWMEEQCYDQINDYYFYLRDYFSYVQWPLRYWDGNSLYPYAAAIFVIYLSDTFGAGIVKDIWERCAEIKGANFLYGALQDAIDEHSNGTRTFEDVFAEYARWVYFTGSRKPHFFEEGAKYPEVPYDSLYAEEYIPYIRVYDTYPSKVAARDYRFFPYELGINYVDFDVTTLGEGLTVDQFVGVQVGGGSEPAGWRISPMAYNRFQPSLPVWVDDSLYHNLETIVVFTVYGEVLEISGNKIRPPYPNPFNMSIHDDLRVTVELLETQTIFMDVFTAAGEKVFSTEASGVRIPVLVWDGRTEHGEKVASGVYLLNVRIGDESETLKALVIQ